MRSREQENRLNKFNGGAAFGGKYTFGAKRTTKAKKHEAYTEPGKKKGSAHKPFARLQKVTSLILKYL